MKKINSIILAIAILGSTSGHSGEVGELTTFTPNTAAKSAEVNANFTAIKTAVNDNDGRVAELAALVDTLDELTKSLNSRIEALQNELDERQSAIEFARNLGEVTTLAIKHGAPSIVFSGVNVYIDNGSGKSTVAEGGTLNGTGNLVIGYNEGAEGNQKSGSHNLVIGPNHFYSGELGIVSGDGNVIRGKASSVISGFGNIADGDAVAAIGGTGNLVNGVYAIALGGKDNAASGEYSAALGGFDSIAANQNSAVIVSEHATALQQNTGFIGSYYGITYNTQSCMFHWTVGDETLYGNFGEGCYEDH